MRGRLITDFEALEAVAAEWDALAEARRQPFSSPGWLLPWWRHARPSEAALRSVLVEDDDGLAGILPLFALRARGRPASYRLLGTGTSSGVEPLARRGCEREVVTAAAETLATAGPALVAFDGIDASSPWPRFLRGCWPGRPRPALVIQRMREAPTVRLEGRTYDEWLRGKGGHFRKRMARARRDIEARGATFTLAEGDAVQGALAAFTALHERRWARRGGSGVLTPAVARMLEDVGRSLPHASRLRVWTLDLDGSPVAAEVLVAAGGSVSFWLSGFDERASSLQPSFQAMLRAIEHAFEVGDFLVDLGEGPQPYKLRVADSERRLAWVALVPPGPAYPLALASALAGRARAGLAARLPAGVKRAARRARRRA